MKKILLSLMVFGLVFSFGFLVNAETVPFTRNLSVGSRGEDVKTLQQILKNKSFLSGIVDGKFGNMTKTAVKKYQTVNGLGADGKVGPKTIAKLNKEIVSPSPVLPSVTVLSPNGGEVITLGQTYTIKWNTTGFLPTDKVSISLKDDSSTCPIGMVGCWTEFGITGVSSVFNTGSYVWDTNQKMFGDGGPNTVQIKAGNNYRIRVEILSQNNNNTLASDLSDNKFSVHTVPLTTPSILQTIYSSFNGNGQISECTYQGAQYYRAGINAYDGGEAVYNTNGDIVGSTVGFTGQSTGVQPTSCTRVYAVYPNIWGFPAINTYNLH